MTIFQKIIEILLQIYFRKESGAKKEFIVYDVKQSKSNIRKEIYFCKKLNNKIRNNKNIILMHLSIINLIAWKRMKYVFFLFYFLTKFHKNIHVNSSNIGQLAIGSTDSVFNTQSFISADIFSLRLASRNETLAGWTMNIHGIHKCV